MEDQQCLALDYEADLVEKVKPTIRYICGSLIIIGLILDLACFKWRKLANAFLYIELLLQLTISFIPSENQGEMSPMYIFVYHYFGFFCYYCDSVGHIIATSVSQALTFFGLMSLIYK